LLLLHWRITAPESVAVQPVLPRNLFCQRFISPCNLRLGGMRHGRQVWAAGMATPSSLTRRRTSPARGKIGAAAWQDVRAHEPVVSRRPVLSAGVGFLDPADGVLLEELADAVQEERGVARFFSTSR